MLSVVFFRVMLSLVGWNLGDLMEVKIYVLGGVQICS